MPFFTPAVVGGIASAIGSIVTGKHRDWETS